MKAMQSKYLTFGIAALACFGANVSRAQLLKIDINNTSRGDNTAPGFTAWNLATDLGSNSNRATRVFTNAANSPISCTVSQTVPAIGTANIGLKADWGNKDGNTTSTDPNAGYRLCTDGVWTHDFSANRPVTNGGAFCLVISNLSA